MNNSTQSNTLHVPSPCSMTMNRLKKEDGFYCGSCKKDIVDFRDKTDEEIIAYFKSASEKTCGIFNEQQVSVPTYSWKHAFLFKALAVMAFIGFNVSPMSAQSTTPQNNQFKNKMGENVCYKKTPEKIKVEEVQQAPQPIKKKRRKHSKKRTMGTIGCPSF